MKIFILIYIALGLSLSLMLGLKYDCTGPEYFPDFYGSPFIFKRKSHATSLEFYYSISGVLLNLAIWSLGLYAIKWVVLRLLPENKIVHVAKLIITGTLVTLSTLILIADFIMLGNWFGPEANYWYWDVDKEAADWGMKCEGEVQLFSDYVITKSISDTISDSTIHKNKLCIDTLLLNQMQIQHHRTIKEGKETWILKYTKPVEARNITTLSYFYSWPPLGEDCAKNNKWFQVDSIQVQLTNSKIQTLKIQEFTAGTSLNKLNAPDSKLIDVNFDGYADVEMGLNEVSGSSNEMRSYYVFNPEKGAFENGIDLANLRLEEEAKLLYTSWSGGHAGRISGRTWSSFVGYDSIRLEKAINSDYNNELDAYIIETVELSATGRYETVIDSVKREDWK